MKAQIRKDRLLFHASLLKNVLMIDSNGIPSNADKGSRTSKRIAQGICDRLGVLAGQDRLAGQMAGNQFEEICAEFVKSTFLLLGHLRPGDWKVQRTGNRNRLEIAQYEQYAHLIALEKAARKDPELAAALGSDYTITPDIIVCRKPESDKTINSKRTLVDDECTRLASLRAKNNPLPILHASISCKWTIRSDRAQNARSEGLNLVRNRKGRLPHVMVITGEPLPSRIASIALGTGDIDCVYHFALHELMETVEALEIEDSMESLRTMVNGKRLRDISDLPLDLAV